MGFRERGGWWVVAQFALFGLILATAWGLGPDDPSGWARTVGNVLFVLGAALGIAGAVPLGAALSPYPAPTGNSALRTGGIHGLVRHPIYGGVILVFIGIALRAASPLAIVLALGLVPFFWLKSTHEERLLTVRFPEYADYRQRVTRRFLPFLI